MPTSSRWLSRAPQVDALKAVIIALSEKMGSNMSSPEKVLSSFVEFLKNASPRLRLAIALLVPWTTLVYAVSRYELIRSAFNAVKTLMVGWLYASVSIPASHPLNKQILSYMVERLGNNARTLALSPPQTALNRYDDPSYTSYLYAGMRSSASPSAKQKRLPNPEDEERQRQSLNFVPDVGTYAFWFQGYRMTLERQTGLQRQYDTNGKLRILQAPLGQETITISCFSPFSGSRPIKDFLNHVKAAPTADHTTTIYRPDGAMWDQGITRLSRNLNAVTLDSAVKDGIVKDVETYLAPETRKYYANRGIPWRRGLLFYGNPGCGKTSFTNALAGHFNLNVYMISLSTHRLSDDILESLFEQLPARCIVLLEDIDSAGIKRDDMRAKRLREKERDRERKKWPHRFDSAGNRIDAYGQRVPDEGAGGVTLSGLLNVLDGIYSKEGMVTIMTSNSPDSLDPALVRPGRIDRKILFGYASREVIAKLFQHIFEKTPEEFVKGEEDSGGHDIAALSEDFASKVPAEKLTPAEVQGYLLVRRSDPAGAVAGAVEWAKELLETKEKGANVAAFQREIQLNEAADQKERRKKRTARTVAQNPSAPPTHPPQRIARPPPSYSTSDLETETGDETEFIEAEQEQASTSASSEPNQTSSPAPAQVKENPSVSVPPVLRTQVSLPPNTFAPTPPMSRSGSRSPLPLNKADPSVAAAMSFLHHLGAQMPPGYERGG